MPRIGIGHHVAARLILLVTAGVVAGVLFHRSTLADLERSRTVTLEEYTAGFDDYRAELASVDLPLWGSVALVVFTLLVVFGGYELLAVGLAQALAMVMPARAPPAPDLGTPGSFRAAPATSRFHSILGRVAIGIGVVGIVGVALAVMVAYRGYQVPEDTDIFSALEGSWAWSGDDSACVTDPHTISFTPARDQMIIAHAKPFEGPDGELDSITRYEILEHTRGRIRGAIPGEQRLTESGEPVVWDLVLRGPDRYAWRRTDRQSPFSFTRDVLRCR
jgi:hypothetical protein